MEKKKEKTTVETHIRICNTLMESEVNPEFKEKVKKHRDMLILQPFHNDTAIVENTNELIETGSMIKDVRNILQEECNGGDEEACVEIPKVNCVHCDNIDMMLHDLQEDEQFKECFDDVFGTQKERTQPRDDIIVKSNDDVIAEIVQKNVTKQQLRAQVLGEVMQKNDPTIQEIAFSQLQRSLTKNKKGE